MAEKSHMKPCTLSLFQARWFNTTNKNLETLVETAWRKLPESGYRIVELNDLDRVIGSKAMESKGEGFFIHCQKYGEGQSASMVDMKSQESIQTKLKIPANSENFQTHEFMGLFFKDYVIAYSAYKNASAIYVYILSLFEKAGFKSETEAFTLTPIPNLEAIKLINAHNIKSIELPFRFSETDQQFADPENRTYNSAIAHKVRAQLDKYLNRKGSFAQSNGLGKLIIANKKTDAGEAHEEMRQFATDLVEDSEQNEYKIELFDVKDKITQDELRVQKTVDVTRYGTGVNRDELWLRMHEYREELSSDEIIE